MKEDLVIRLGQSLLQPVHWLIWSESQQEIIASGELENAEQLSLLTEKAQNRRVVTLLAAAAVQLKSVRLPSKWNRKLEQALPFIIEEELACDVDDVFIAIGQPIEDLDGSAIEVAVVDRALLESWISELAAHEISTQIMVPDALLLPKHDGLSAIELAGSWLFRGQNWLVAEVESTWLKGFLESITQDEGGEVIHHYSPFPAESESVTLQEQPYELPLAVLIKQLSAVSFNLLQGPYQVKKSTSKMRSIWQTTGIAAAVALVANLLIKGVEIYQLDSELAQVKQSITEQYKQAFPNKKVRPALIRKQIQQQLKLIEGGNSGGFLSLFSDVTAAFNQVKGFSPESIRYDAKRDEIRIRAQAAGFQSFESAKTILEQQGLAVEQGSLNNDGEAVVGELRIRRS